MESKDTQTKRFIHRTTQETYRVVWMKNKAVILENDDSVQVLTTTWGLNTYYEPLPSPHSNSLLK